MKYIVKMNLHDWPKRSQSKRDQIVVEADSDADALDVANADAMKLWPGGKAKAYDVRLAPESIPLSVPKRKTLTARPNA